jgi:mannose-1-phosphate guanylyltransferase
VQALILAGGEGTRLRPLTSTTPKPVIPLVGRPFVGYMIEWLRDHGVDDVILSCGFMADGVRAVLGDGAELGVRLRYVEEPKPLGTAGALRFAEDLLDERFFMLNGDVLTDIDLTAQLAQHERTGARATLALIAVEDPSAYGLVRLAADHSVTAFLEKPGAGEKPAAAAGINLINAGAYILERDVLDVFPPAGTNASIEREVFPVLVGEGLFGFAADGYWLDIGTPERYLQATFDILDGIVRTAIGERLAESERAITGGAQVQGRVVAPALLGRGCRIASGAIVGGRTVLGAGVEVGEGAQIETSVVLDDTRIGPRTTIRNSIIGARVTIGERCQIDGEVVVGDGVGIGSDNALARGARIFPGVQLPTGAIRF